MSEPSTTWDAFPEYREEARAWKARALKYEQALREAELQIEYLHEKFGETGSGNGVLARIRAALDKPEGK